MDLKIVLKLFLKKWMISFRIGVDISPIIKNEEQYEYWLDTLPFYKNIHEEGVIVNG